MARYKREEEKRIKCNEFLSNYSKNRKLDTVFKKWMYRKDETDSARTISQWQELFQKFMNE